MASGDHQLTTRLVLPQDGREVIDDINLQNDQLQPRQRNEQGSWKRQQV
ncbi:hypothetical protein E2C01_084212 [Portunus trituberculatus]|uniref:Uncharacterized protein n=1 Tax=Portunus trituberculatus TaxID=210409 RepID=A0A5B7JA40_PORTR|nr:hypothetical protein [Portunus trituberculatus]